MVASTGVTALSNFIEDRWANELSDATQSQVVWSDRIDTRYEKVMSVGDTIHIPDRSNPGVRIKLEASPATLANILETEQQVTVNRQAYSYFEVEDIADMQSSYDARSEYTEGAGYSLMAFMEGNTTSGMASLLASLNNLKGNYGSDPADDDWLDAVKTLDKGDVPRGRDRYALVSTATNLSLLKNSKFFRQETVGQAAAEQAIQEATVGRIYGMDVMTTSLLNDNPATNQSISVVGHRRGIALIRQRKPTVHIDFIIADIAMAALIDTVYQFATRVIAPSSLGGGASTDRFSVGLKGA